MNKRQREQLADLAAARQLPNALKLKGIHTKSAQVIAAQVRERLRPTPLVQPVVRWGQPVKDTDVFLRWATTVTADHLREWLELDRCITERTDK